MDFKIDNIESVKQRILGFIEIGGPTLPIKISSHFRIDSLISSAILSELVDDKKLKVSFMRVGNSPVYYIKGQEFQLESFVNYLNGKEREAFELLRDNKILEDSKVLPAIRVALRNIKDFAFPFEHRENLYWRHIKINEQQAVEIAENLMKKKPIQLFQRGIEIKEFQPKIQGIEIEKRQTEFIEPIKVEEIEEKKLEENKGSIEVEKIEETPAITPKVAKKRKIKQKSDFETYVLEFLEQNKIEIIEKLKSKKKEINGIISSENKNYIFAAKDKKIITEPDITSLLKLGKKSKMPVFFVSDGEPNTKAREWLEYLEGKIVFKRMGEVRNV